MPVTVLLNSQILQRIGEHFLAFRKCLWLLNSSANILKHHHQSNHFHNQAIHGASNSKLIFGHFQTQVTVLAIYSKHWPRRASKEESLAPLAFLLAPRRSAHCGRRQSSGQRIAKAGGLGGNQKLEISIFVTPGTHKDIIDQRRINQNPDLSSEHLRRGHISLRFRLTVRVFPSLGHRKLLGRKWMFNQEISTIWIIKHTIHLPVPRLPNQRESWSF